MRSSSMRSVFEPYLHHLVLDDRAMAFYLVYGVSKLGLALMLSAEIQCHFIRRLSTRKLGHLVIISLQRR